MNNIYLIGMMGSGKTAVSEILSELLDRERVDLDACIVTRETCSINAIFAAKGETYFRAVEQDVLREISEKENLIVSTGGGIVLNEENFEIMRETGTVVYLQAPTDILYHRLKDKNDRPLLKVASPQAELDKIFKARKQLYEKGDLTVNTQEKSPREVAEEIIAQIKAQKK